MKTWILLLAAVAAVANAAAVNVEAGVESSLIGVEKRCVGGLQACSSNADCCSGACSSRLGNRCLSA
ncbi:uncharacterized protein BO66DRAFT_467713 [Aspergillus aculeatinus CBS 121060]|uniref:Uncharacterized protein n=1 Tax=Aspergillus aculeatinus CBS 121060 TaxID=1448322 RepID=A0ACD1HNH1_9EURO|nr:hypothetical protein BO66DRAFT_467713 [Aspergillus aculeatinus CBS 121060]RAH75120.1 hypothetical protein BO66DRAFT_467713 [Aspergillus aculeatinus CBS 121060]